MVLGKWSWSSDAEAQPLPNNARILSRAHTHFIVFNEDNTCSFQNLDEETIEAYEG